jgi:two-component system nitrate/nitrite response regulator NarL
MGPSPALKTLVVDDHPLVTEMLARVIEADDRLELAGTCADGNEAIEAITELAPDVAVLDIGMPLGAADVAALLNGLGLPTRMLFLSGADDSATLYRALLAGAHGFIAKTASPAAIADAIAAVGSGSTAFPPAAAEAMVAGRETEQRQVSLSPRELQVLSLAARGKSTAEVAAALFLGQTTVKAHLRNVAEKLGVQGKAATIAEAMRRGLLE